VCVCQVVDRNIPHSFQPDMVFHAKVDILRQYLSVVLEHERVYLYGNIESFLRLIGSYFLLMVFIVTLKGSIVYTVAIAVQL
jgi:hypothetical protein